MFVRQGRLPPGDSPSLTADLCNGEIFQVEEEAANPRRADRASGLLEVDMGKVKSRLVFVWEYLTMGSKAALLGRT